MKLWRSELSLSSLTTSIWRPIRHRTRQDVDRIREEESQVTITPARSAAHPSGRCARWLWIATRTPAKYPRTRKRRCLQLTLILSRLTEELDIKPEVDSNDLQSYWNRGWIFCVRLPVTKYLRNINEKDYRITRLVINGPHKGGDKCKLF